MDVIETLPESPSTLEQAFDTRLELRPVLTLLGELRRQKDLLREAEILAEQLNDDRRRGRVCAFLTSAHSLLGEFDEALGAGTRALEIAGHLGDLRLRIGTTSHLDQVCYYRGEYERVVELATGNLAALPADWLYEYFGAAAPASVFDRSWLVMSLAQLGRFAEATLDKGNEALDRIREGEQLLERLAARGIIHFRGWDCQQLGRACLLLGKLDEAQRLAECAAESSTCQPGFAAHAQRLLGDIATHPDRFDGDSGQAHYRKALALAEPLGMPPLAAHCHLGLGKLYKRTGKREQAEEHLAAATTMYREMDMRPEQADAAASRL